MFHDMGYISLLGEPAVKNFMSHANAKCIDAEKLFGFTTKCYGDAQLFFGMPPMKVLFRFLHITFAEYPAIGLIFNI